MLLANRSHRMLYISLAGMEIAWFLPMAITIVSRWYAPLISEGEYTPLTLRPFSTFALFWSVMLGDLVSINLAEQRGVDPLPVDQIVDFKKRLGAH